jgi:hypothetical protein
MEASGKRYAGLSSITGSDAGLICCLRTTNRSTDVHRTHFSAPWFAASSPVTADFLTYLICFIVYYYRACADGKDK